MATLKLPRKHAADWLDRTETGATAVASTPRTVTLELTDAQLADLKADATYYAENMHGDWTDGIDYRAAARRCLAAIEKTEGIK